jgi:hypothetical protein
MSTAATPRPEPSAEQLRLAFRQLRTAHWPATVELALEHAIYGPLVRTQALRMSRVAWTAAPPPRSLPRHVPDVPPTPEHQPTARRTGLPRLTHDPRRLAANDHE